MQEVIVSAVDNYYDDMDNGVVVERPFIFTIPKGTRGAFLRSVLMSGCREAVLYRFEEPIRGLIYSLGKGGGVPPVTDMEG
jgi:hypothetical protein